MAFGIDPNKFKDYEESYNRQEAFNKLSQPAAEPQKSEGGGVGGFLRNLLPTLGGTGGTLGGAAVGAGIGTAILPGIGTGIGALLGAIGGGAGGSALGKGGQNLIEGKDIGEGVGEEALFGGLTSLPFTSGLKVLKGVGAASKGLGSKALQEFSEAGTKALPGPVSGKFAQEAGTDLSKDMLPNVGILNKAKLADKATTAGSRLLASQSKGALDKQLASQAPEIYKAMNRYGFNNAGDFQKAASKVTGDVGAINHSKMYLLQNAKNTIKIPNWRTNASEVIDDAIGLTDRDPKSLGGILQKADDKIMKGMSGRAGNRAVGIGEAHPEDIYKVAQELQQSAYKSLGNKSYDAASDARQAKFDVLMQARNDLRGAVDTALGGSPVTAQLKNDMIKELASQGITNKNLIKDVQNAKTLGDLNKIEKVFVDASKVGEETLSAANARGLSVPTDYRGTTLTGLATNAIIPSANRLAGRALLRTGEKLGEQAGGAQGILGLATRQGLGSTAAGVFTPGQEEVPTDETLGGGSLSDYQMAGADMLGSGDIGSSDLSGADQQMEAVQQSPFSLQNIQQAVMKDIQQTGGKNIDQLITLYKVFGEQSQPKINSTTQKALAQSDNGLNTIDQLQSLYSEAGGGSNILGGGLQNLLGSVGLDKNANVYNSQRSAAIASLAKSFGDTGTLSDSDIKRYDEMLPKLTDTPDQAQAKFDIIRQRLSSAKDNTLMYGGFGNDQSQLMQ